MRILIDECLPIRMRHLRPEHDARTVEFMGWKGLENGDLLKAAERDGFDVVLTCDGSMYRQNDLRGRTISVVVLPTNDLDRIKSMIGIIAEALQITAPGEYRVLAGPASDSS